MNIKKIYIILLAGFAVFTQSCNKLDLKPTDSIDPTKAFRNLQDVNMGVLGAYAPLDYTLIDISAIVSDEIMLPTENTVSNTVAHRWMYNSSYGSVTGAWSEYYLVIDRANRVLEALPEVTNNIGQSGVLDQYKGELLAIRGFAHFELLKAYASSYESNGMGVPYMKKHELGYPSRPSVSDNFKDIMADLEQAKNLIPANFNNNTRVTRTAVSAIQARVALYAKDWSSALAYATEAINSKGLTSKDNYKNSWSGNGGAESIWQLARVPGDSQIGSAFFRQTGDIVLYAPSFKLINLFDKEKDIRFSSFINYDQARQDNSSGRKSAYLIRKYDGNDARYPGLSNIPLFGVGEMYLIRAEAQAEMNNINAASQDLNELRKARIDGYVSQNYSNKQTVLDAIYNERFKELAFEGHRFFDLKRRGVAIERNQEDAINASGADRLDPSTAQYCFPLPSDEMSVNKNITQNPNY